MKNFFRLPALLLLLQTAVYAQSPKEYKPVIRSFGTLMDLENSKSLEPYSQKLLAAGFRDVTDSVKPKISNVRLLERVQRGASTMYELYYLPDGRIYELVMSIDGDKSTRYGAATKMGAQKIAFNKVSNTIYKELGSPTMSAMEWEQPYSRADWEDDARTAAALMQNKLFVFFGYVSDRYKGTDDASVYITLDPFLRVRIGVKDIELSKQTGVSQNKPASSDSDYSFMNTVNFMFKVDQTKLCNAIKRITTELKNGNESAIFGEKVDAETSVYYPKIELPYMNAIVEEHPYYYEYSGFLKSPVMSEKGYTEEFDALSGMVETCLGVKPVKLLPSSSSSLTKNIFAGNGFHLAVQQNESRTRVSIVIQVKKNS
ncbi:hypothetical protein DLD77_00685 [Chitinophaga alhagiae]|uniref:Uncharacterized protein n=1 Tax=Chitinophaga alhagiae TaxID=2203219 RepID=A0ABM6W8T2_9BACT|nr:hypothetical protein [Chitinophaga alhagiae]AWO00326.1 hypothetical protein DLD77_00685 [Chitinophaga alhagiae]